MTAADIVSSIFRKFEKKSLSPKEIRDESSRICKLLNIPDVGDPGRTARGFAEAGYVIKDSDGNCTYDPNNLSEIENAKFCNYEYVYNRIPESLLKATYFLEIPLVDEPDTDDLVKTLGELLAKEKASKNGYAIHYFGLKYGKLIIEKNISIKSIITAALNFDKNFGSEHYDVELSKGIGVYKLAKADGLEKISTGDGNVLADQKSNENPSLFDNLTDTSLEPLILYGPPGTGKTYKMQHDYIDKFAKEDSFVTTFHQSFSYEEFVEGLKPILEEPNKEKKVSDTCEPRSVSSDVKYKIEKGIFYKACEQAAKLAGFSSLQECISSSDRKQKMNDAVNNNKIVLLCIDEINRANVSAVFGDLISLIEPSKRIGAKNEMIVSLPYSKEQFAVPANLMIVGTMNTADRSIQLLDSALRRRFRFEELLPDYTKITYKPAESILKAINARIRCLLDKDHQIGHSYFIEAENDLDIFNALKDCVIPLLEEYFYNDTQKIRQILNENDDSTTNFYVRDEEAQNALNGMQSDFDNEKELFTLNSALSNVNDKGKAASFITHIVSASE